MNVIRAALVALFVLAVNARAAPPPPPPPPPENAPLFYEGYDTGAIWRAYYTWVMRRVADARPLALDIAPPPEAMTGYYRIEQGPRARWYDTDTGGAQSGLEIRLDRWCPTAGQQRCVWLARQAHDRYGVVQEFSRANFDVARAVAFLRANSVSPQSSFNAQSFGLPDPLDTDPMRYIRFSQAEERECSAVLEAVAAARRIRARLVVTSEAAADAEPPPPPHPHGGAVELVLPQFYVHRRGERRTVGASITLWGHAATLAQDISSTIFNPLEECLQARE